MNRIKSLVQEPLQGNISLIFMFLAVCMAALMAIYWTVILEPRLRAEAESYAKALASYQALEISDALDVQIMEKRNGRVVDAIDRALLTTDPNTRTPFTIRLEVEISEEFGGGEVFRGVQCESCFTSKIPLYSRASRELLGIARFQMSDKSFQTLRNDIRTKLAWGAIITIGLLIGAWRGVAGLSAKARKYARDLSQANETLMGEIDERERAESELKLLMQEQKTLLDHTRDFVYMYDVNGVFQYLSPAVKQITGYTVDEWKTHYSHFLTDNPINTKVVEYMEKALRDGEEFPPYPVEVYHKNGGRVWLEISEKPFTEDGKVAGVIGAARDVTDRKKAEDDLIKAKEAAERATELKDKFVSIVSHDLRSPIASIKSAAVFLSPQNASMVDEENKKKAMELIAASADGLIKLIDRLLDINRLKSGKIVPHKMHVNIHNLVKSNMERLQSLAGSKGVTMVNSLPDDITMLADPALIGTVIGNILSNGVKFTRAGDTITVYVPDDRKRTIAIRDTGVGIDANILPALFTHEINTTMPGTAGEKGTGLGLPYCKDIMDAHGGNIFVESTHGEGSVFYISFRESSSLLVVIDENHSRRRVIKQIFSTSDMEISEAESLEEGLEILRKCAPHTVLAVVDGGESDGQRLLDALSIYSEFRKTPMIVIAGEECGLTEEKILELGCAAMLSTSFTPQDIIRAVKKQLQPEHQS